MGVLQYIFGSPGTFSLSRPRLPLLLLLYPVSQHTTWYFSCPGLCPQPVLLLPRPLSSTGASPSPAFIINRCFPCFGLCHHLALAHPRGVSAVGPTPNCLLFSCCFALNWCFSCPGLCPQPVLLLPWHLSSPGTSTSKRRVCCCSCNRLIAFLLWLFNIPVVFLWLLLRRLCGALRCPCGASAVLCGASALPLWCLCGASADASAVKEQTSEKRMNGQKRAKNETERRAKAPPYIINNVNYTN